MIDDVSISFVYLLLILLTVQKNHSISTTKRKKGEIKTYEIILEAQIIRSLSKNTSNRRIFC